MRTIFPISKSIFIPSIIVSQLVTVAACVNLDKTDDISIDFSDFNIASAVADTTFAVGDTVPLVVGKIEPLPSGYMMYLYDNDHFIGLADESFALTRLSARRGQGPGELNGVSGNFGQVLDTVNTTVSVFDPYSASMYALDTQSGILQKHLHFPTNMSKYSPFDVMRLKNGMYISPRGDFQYGIVAFNPANNEVSEWPIGLPDIDTARPDENHVSLRAYDYNEHSGLIAEIYGVIPTVVVHDESGAIVKTITIKGLPQNAYNPTDYFRDICMTDDLIFILWGDPSVDPMSLILVTTHSGEPVCGFEIRPAQTMSLDKKNGTILTTNPDCEDSNIAVYGHDLLTPTESAS